MSNEREVIISISDQIMVTKKSIAEIADELLKLGFKKFEIKLSSNKQNKEPQESS